MRIGVLSEHGQIERRVALTPDAVTRLLPLGVEVLRLHERELVRELQHAEPSQLKELQEALTRVRERVGALS